MSTTNGPRHTGTIKWFNEEKAFGFIVPDVKIDGIPGDVFLHVNNFAGDPANLREGVRVVFGIGEKRGRKHATLISIV